MKLSNKQQKELEILLWMGAKPTSEEIKIFFERSTKGMHKDLRWEENCLMVAKRYRDLQIAMWMEDWGKQINAWSFVDEPQEIAEWIAQKLDREAIMMAWHEHRYRWWKPPSWKHKNLARRYQNIIANKPFNKPMNVRRSE